MKKRLDTLKIGSIVEVKVGRTKNRTVRAIVVNVWKKLGVAHVHIMDDSLGSSLDDINVYEEEIVW